MSTDAALKNAELAAMREGALAAARYHLPFGRQVWRGRQGAWQGAGAGSSIDFQDHRDYIPGDDPRHIHWAAYARTGQLTMKLYRAEVSPLVDVMVDVSGSMTFTAAKAARLDALAAFCVASADRAGAPSRVHSVSGSMIRSVPAESARAGRIGRFSTAGRDAAARDAAGLPGPLPWRAGALKVFVSDLLFPGDPAPLLAGMSAGGGLALVFAPALESEAEAPGRGNMELTDCETGGTRRQRIDDALAARYRDAYARHFALWREAARRRDVLLVRVPCEGALVDALGGEPRANGAVELTG
ncbi:DUF58 domain-containing protein [Termitidicoccus mucosus]|uniref:DUF58 domain-containing protein n=1 Tax=Termitidicoccus mucosus TaxID=1184151 RepID=UPI002FEE368B